MKQNLLILIILMFIYTIPTLSLELIKKDLKALYKSSIDIIEGEVISVECYRNKEEKVNYTHVAIKVTKSYKGKLSGEIVLKDLGGRVGDNVTMNIDQARYTVGETVLVSVLEYQNSLVTNCNQYGKFTIKTKKGKKHIERNIIHNQHYQSIDNDIKIEKTEAEYDKIKSCIEILIKDE
jgi:hypothetical protein